MIGLSRLTAFLAHGRLRRIATLLAIALIAAAPSSPRAAELIMLDEEWCEWCQLWEEEVGVIYHKTPEGARAPLRRISIHAREAKSLNLKTRAHYTPTFVLMSDGQEVGRIEGYPGEDFFWGLLQRLLERLPAQEGS